MKLSEKGARVIIFKLFRDHLYNLNISLNAAHFNYFQIIINF